MRVRANLEDVRWHLLAKLLDVRVFLVVLFSVFLLYPVVSFQGLNFVDRQLFGFGAFVKRSSMDASQYVRIDIPADEMKRFLRDPVSAKATLAMFSELLQGSPAGVAIVLHNPQWIDYDSNDFLRVNSQSIIPSLSGDALREYRDISSLIRMLDMYAADKRIVRAYVQDNPDTPGAGWRRLAGLISPDDDSVLLYRYQGSDSADEFFPVMANSLEKPLRWNGSNGLKNDAALALLLGMKKWQAPLWMPGGGMKFQNHVIPLSTESTYIPMYSSEFGRAPEIFRIPLSALKGQETRRIIHEKTVVIGEDRDVVADNLVYDVMSLESGHYAILSPWFMQAHFFVLLFLLLYFLVYPYMRMKVTFLLSALFLLVLIFAQQIILLLHQQWVPVSFWLLFLVSSHLLMFLWCLRRSFYPLEIGSPAVGTLERSFRRVRDITSGVLISTVKKSNTRRVSPTFGIEAGAGAEDDDTVLEKTRPIASASSALSRSPHISKRHLGRYQIKRELGRGAMGVVYLGFDPKISRDVAIKTLHYDQFEAQDLPAVKERFFREAAAAGRLRHPNIVTIYDAGEEPDMAYMAMDFVDGQSLAAFVKKGQLLDVETVYWIVAQVADAVDYANVQGIVHRDIKPSNILFDDNTNEVKVADFGIARIMDGSATKTRTGDILGSPLYMSPEQIRGEQVTGSSDIYSIGVTFYQLLTGELPFKADSLANLSYQIVHGKYISVDEVRQDLPESARRIISKSLQKNPANRYQSAGDMAIALQRALGKEFS